MPKSEIRKLAKLAVDSAFCLLSRFGLRIFDLLGDFYNSL